MAHSAHLRSGFPTFSDRKLTDFQIFLILFLIIVAFVVALLLLFG